MHPTSTPLVQRLLEALDLAIDFATLGEYGLEVDPGGGQCRERPGRKAGWEALAVPAAGSDGRSSYRAASHGRASRRGAAACHAPRPAARLGTNWGF